MSVLLYVDHHVPMAITEGLRQRSVDVVTAHEDGRAEQGDAAILERATSLNRAVFSQDEDFLALAHEWLENGREFAGVIYAHQLKITIGQAVRDLELIATVLSDDEMRNRIEFLPIR
jgi:predicted nuclease of predicted toxin-antitoxin system